MGKFSSFHPARTKKRGNTPTKFFKNGNASKICGNAIKKEETPQLNKVFKVFLKTETPQKYAETPKKKRKHLN